eukprot:4447094-Karenia_brevis.AAC.1
MHQIGCKDMVSVHVLSTASKSRFVHKHHVLIHELHRALMGSVADLPLSCMSNVSRSFWKWPPLVCTILEAASGLEFEDQEIVDVLRQAVDGADASGEGVQRSVYRALVCHIHDLSVHSLLIKRCCKYFPCEAINYQRVDWPLVFQIATAMSQHVSCCLFKTLSGAWLTTRRLQSAVKPCLFCKLACADSLQHIVECDIFWKAISDAFLPFLPHFSP